MTVGKFQNKQNAGAAELPVPAKKKTFVLYKKNISLFIMFLIPFSYYALFHYGPMYGIIIAFKDYRFLDGIVGSAWVGFDHFKYAFGLTKFWTVVKNTVIISFLRLLFGFPAPIILALLLNELRTGVFKKVTQTIFYLPHFLSWVVLGGVLMAFLSPSSGAINGLIKLFGGDPIFFLGNKEWFRFILISTSIWKNVGWGTIIYLAALSGIDPQLYEAATIDGAGKFKQVVHITLPSLTPVITITFIFAVGRLITDDFDQIFNLYNSAVYSVGDVLSTYVYRIGLEGMRYGFATAVEVFKNLIAFGLIVGTNYVARKNSDYGLW